MSQQCLTIVVKKQDMDTSMQTEAKNFIWDALQRNKDYKSIAAAIKSKMDEKYHPNWHVVVGRSFSSYVTHENHHFVYLTALGMHFLIFKS